MKSNCFNLGKFFSQTDQEYRADLHQICERAVSAFRSQECDRPPSLNSSGKWSEYGWEGRLQNLADLIRSESYSEILNLVMSFFKSSAAYGIAMGDKELAEITSTPHRIALYEDQWMQALIRLGQCLGCSVVINPEAEEIAYDSKIDLYDLIVEIQSTLGYELKFPQKFGVYGCLIGEGELFPRISFGHVMMEFLIRNNLNWGKENSVLEIGGGFGGLAYFVAKSQVVRYISVDTPVMLFFQALFLSQACPELPLQLYGENELPKHCTRSVTLLPSWVVISDRFENSNVPQLDLIVNQDTLMDLSPSDLSGLVKPLLPSLKGGLLSVSPDYSSAGSVWGRRVGLRHELSSLGLTLIDRAPFLVRDGYMRELYRMNRP